MKLPWKLRKLMWWAFKVPFIIVEKREGGYALFMDRGRRVTARDGTETYELKGGDNLQSWRFEDLIMSKGGPVAMAYSPAPGQYLPLKIDDTDKDGKISLKAVGQDDLEFLARWIIRAQRLSQGQSFWDKWMPAALLAMVVMGLFLISYTTVPSTNAMLSSTAASYADAAESNREMVAEMKTLTAMLTGYPTGQVTVINYTQSGPPG